MTPRYLVADVFDGLATLDTDSVDLIVTSPPFLALRSYLPADHPDKSKEIGSEATPAEFLDVLLKVTAEWRRVLAPHGSICVELGDTYAGSGGAGGDYDEDGLRAGQPRFRQRNDGGQYGYYAPQVNSKYNLDVRPITGGTGWPLAKSRTLIPQLYEIALAYGINPLTGQPSPAGQWRVRNVVTWARPNPPVGALGDKWRPATSDVVVACVSDRRYWDDLATRKPADPANKRPSLLERKGIGGRTDQVMNPLGEDGQRIIANAAGAPLLDYWEIPPGGYKGSHYAVFPPELVVPLVRAMCPQKVCRTCGEPSRRIVTEKVQIASDERKALAVHIKTQRLAKGLSQKEVAVHFPSASGGVTGCVWNWENAANVPTTEQWPVLVDLLDLSNEYAYLIEGERQWGWTESLVKYQGGEHGFVNDREMGRGGHQGIPTATRIEPDAGFTDCGHDDYRPGLVLDPFAGSGTTLMVAHGHGFDTIGIDLDERNAELALERVGPMFLEVEGVSP